MDTVVLDVSADGRGTAASSSSTSTGPVVPFTLEDFQTSASFSSSAAPGEAHRTWADEIEEDDQSLPPQFVTVSAPSTSSNSTGGGSAALSRRDRVRKRQEERKKITEFASGSAADDYDEL